jgi:WD40 repeat protein
VRIWDWQRGTVVRTIDDARLVDFDPSGSRIVTVSEEGRAEIRDVASGKRVAVLAGQLASANDVAFSPDGSLIAAAGSDGTIRLFDADSGAQHLVLPGTCEINDLAFSPDGTKLASAGWCGGVRVWALDIDDLLRIARDELTRTFTEDECHQYLHLETCPSASPG